MLRSVALRTASAALIALATVAVLPAPGGAQSINPMVVATEIVLDGQCTKAVFLGQDVTGDCGTTFATNEVPPDRVQFHFRFREGAVITLTGKDRTNAAPDLDEVRVTRLLLTIGAGDPVDSSKEATGRCRVGDLSVVGARIECEGVMAQRPFAFQFISNGQPPR